MDSLNVERFENCVFIIMVIVLGVKGSLYVVCVFVCVSEMKGHCPSVFVLGVWSWTPGATELIHTGWLLI